MISKTSPGARRSTVQKTFFRKYLLPGLTALLPTVLTGFVLYKLWEYAHNAIGSKVVEALRKEFLLEQTPAWLTVAGDAAGLALIIFIALAIGFALTSFLGTRLFRAAESSLLRMPLISTIYKPIKQITDFLLSEKSQQFRNVVAIEYPRKGVYSIGFVTNAGFKDLATPDGRRMIGVFIPSSPTPFTGYIVFVPESEVIPLSIPIEDSLRFVISGGVICPSSQLPEAVPTKLTPPETDGEG